MPLHPSEYAKLLARKIEKHHARCWLINTGWTGGPYGVGHRISIKYTRALLNAALDGRLEEVEYAEDPFFGLQVPAACPDVPADILMPRNTWQDKSAYDAKARIWQTCLLKISKNISILCPNRWLARDQRVERVR